MNRNDNDIVMSYVLNTVFILDILKLDIYNKPLLSNIKNFKDGNKIYISGNIEVKLGLGLESATCYEGFISLKDDWVEIIIEYCTSKNYRIHSLTTDSTTVRPLDKTNGKVNESFKLIKGALKSFIVHSVDIKQTRIIIVPKNHKLNDGIIVTPNNVVKIKTTEDINNSILKRIYRESLVKEFKTKGLEYIKRFLN